MLEVAALFYGVFASFIMASVQRNRREQRAHAPILAMFGWFLLAFSGVSGAMLLGYAGYQAATGGAVV